MRAENSLLACLGSTGACLALFLGLGSPATSTLQAAPPVQGAYGTIKGRLVWGGASAPEPAPLVKKGDKAVKDAEVCAATNLPDRGLQVDPASKGVAHAFAYLAGTLKGKNAEAEKALVKATPTVVVDQKNCEFLPYSTAMHEAQPITFKSSDAIGHNVRYSGFVNGSKNIALAPNGELANQKLKAERRPMPINCDIHPWMKGWVMVFDHPFYAVTKADGSFEISGVPAGAQNLVVWQEKVGYVTTGGAKGMAVTVKAGETVDVGEIKLDPAKVKK
jgi:plastocyanin